MSIRHTPNFRRLAALLLIGSLAGCGPTRTAGTGGVAARDLAVLSIAQLPEEAHVQIHTIQFDGAGDEYEIGNSRDFYLLPRDHTASVTFTASVPEIGGFADMLLPNRVTLPGPKNIPLGAMTAGKTYELALPTEGLDQMLLSGQISLVREKSK